VGNSISDGSKNIRIKEEELMTFLQKNNTYKRGRTI
jgi:hypothetical protein